MGDYDPTIGIIIVLLLIVIYGFVSSAETALKYLNDSVVKKRAEEGDKRSIKLLRLMDQPVSYFFVLETVLLISSFFMSFFYAAKLYHLLDSKPVILILVNILFLYIIVLFGNILPKKLAVLYSESIANKLSGFIILLITILRPFTFLVEGGATILLFLFRMNGKVIQGNVTEDGIISMVNEGHEQGVLEANEAEMISNIIDFNETEVKDIMTHRKKVVALCSETKVEEALRFMLNESYSRFPVYEENIDNIVGILHLKDVTRVYVSEKMKDRFILDFAREPYFVPDTQSIDVLFHDMQIKKMHMAIAIDEYGQTAGIVAMEDILEEIVGNILDEYDVDETLIVDKGNGIYVMNGLAELDEIEDLLEIEFEQEEFDTLNGFLINKLGHVPVDEEKEVIEFCGYKFQITEVKDNIILSVIVRKI